MPTWPESLPQEPGADGFQETAPNLVVRTQMDAGPPKVRRRFTAGVRTFAMRFVLSEDQVDTLDAFFIEDCAGGAIPFDWKHPRTNAPASFRFVEPPTYTSLGGDCWSANVSVELLP